METAAARDPAVHTDNVTFAGYPLAGGKLVHALADPAS